MGVPRAGSSWIDYSEGMCVMVVMMVSPIARALSPVAPRGRRPHGSSSQCAASVRTARCRALLGARLDGGDVEGWSRGARGV